MAARPPPPPGAQSRSSVWSPTNAGGGADADGAGSPDAAAAAAGRGGSAGASAGAAAAGAGVAPFVASLVALLDDARNAAVIHWGADGASVVIEDEGALVASVLPAYFNHSQVNSFYRQLSFYNFRRTRDEAPDDALGTHLLAQLEAARAGGGGRPRRGTCVEYRHRDFLRGRPDLLPNVVRKTNKVRSMPVGMGQRRGL
jgi:hypothetical protein